jgi:CRP-like cAMP-binding protein/Zn-dependent protease
VRRPRGGRVPFGPAASAVLAGIGAVPDPSDDRDVFKALGLRILLAPGPSPDIWQSVARRTDPASWRPTLLPGVEIVRLDWARTGPRALAARGSTVVPLQEDGADLVPLMDGNHTVADLVAQLLYDTGDLGISSVAELVRMLRSLGLLVEKSSDVEAALEHALDDRPAWRDTVRRLTRSLSVEWGGADRLVRWIYRHGLRHLINRWGALASVVVALSGVVALGFVLTDHPFHLSTQSAGWGFVLLMTLTAAIVFIHELGHATMVVHHGRSVHSAGVRLYYGAPAFFVDAPQALLLPQKQRIAQAFAGPWFESVAGGAAAIVLWLIPTGWAAPVLYRFVVINYFMLLMNLVPLLELDGYLIFSDAIGMPDLRARSVAFLRRELWWKLRGATRLSGVDLGLGAYAVVGAGFVALSLVLSAFFWSRTFGGVVSRMWHAGPVGVALLFVLGAVLAGPMLQAGVEALRGVGGQAVRTWHRLRFRLQRRWRIEAAEAIDRLDVFEDLPAAALDDLAGRVRLATFSRFQTVVSQGGPADAYFAVRHGRLSVFEDLPGGAGRRVLRELVAGQGFGELALVRRAPRSVSVEALGPAELFVVDLGTFDRLLTPHLRVPEFAPTIAQAAELAAVPSLRSLDLTELTSLLSAGDWRSVPPYRDLVVQGEPPDGFYFLLEGQAEVLVDGRRIRVLEHASHFGELALLETGPRTATVRTLTPARLFHIDAAAFNSMLARSFSATLADRGELVFGVDRRS